MTVCKFITNQVCCVYCHNEFPIKGKTRWHNCSQSLAVRKVIEKERVKVCRNKINYGKQFLKNVFNKDGWKKCKRCKITLTPNFFGICERCLEKLGTLYDLDMIQTFEQGYEKRIKCL